MDAAEKHVLYSELSVISQSYLCTVQPRPREITESPL